MNEQFAQEIAALEAQERIFTADMERIAHDPVQAPTYHALQAELNVVREKIAAKKAQVNEVQEAVQTAQEELTAALDSIQIGDETVSLRALTTDEASYQLLYITLQQMIADQTQKFRSDIIALKESYESQIEELEIESAEIPQLRADNARLSDKCADLETKLDAAADRTFEAEEDVKRLTEEVGKLRKQIEDTAKPKPTQDGKSALEAWKASRPKIYNLHWVDDRKKNTYAATLAETGEPIEFNHLELGKYNVITEQEVSQFRNEAAEVEEAAVPDTPLANGVEPPSQPFQAEVPDENNPVEGFAPDGALAPETRTIEERLADLERRVSFLEVLK